MIQLVHRGRLQRVTRTLRNRRRNPTHLATQQRRRDNDSQRLIRCIVVPFELRSG